MAVYEVLRRATALWPNRPFASTSRNTCTYSEFNERVIETASDYRQLGDDLIVAVLGENSLARLLATFATAAAGGTFINLHSKNSLDANLEICSQGRPDVIVADTESLAQAEELCRRVRSIRGVLRLEEDDDGFRIAGCPVRHGPPLRPVDKPLAAVAYLSPTGGTTGLPKLAPVTGYAVNTLIANAWAALDFWTYEPRHLVVAPLSHGANGLLNILTASGAHHVIRPRFDRSLVLDLIGDLGITDIFLPPTAIYSLLADPSLEQRDLRTLRHIVYAGAPISVEKLREGLEKIGPVFTQFFGQAEAPLTATCLSPADHVEALERHPQRLSSCGRPTLFTELAVLGEQDELLEHGELGEIGIRGPLAMAGFVGELPRSAEQWHRTGDVGYVDSDGYVFLVDRKRDVIVSGGFNVFPIEVEQALWAIPEVEDCAVIGLPDEKWGEAVTAFVLLKEGMKSDEAHMIAHCRKVVGPVKAPKSIRIVESLPRSPVGKVLKRELRNQFWTSRDRRV